MHSERKFLRKMLGRSLADAGATAHQIMAVLDDLMLLEAERYTREADRRRTIEKLGITKLTEFPPNLFRELGEVRKNSNNVKVRTN